MGLKEIAIADSRKFIEDTDLGFGVPIKVTNPDGVPDDLTGISNDVGLIFDPDTGVSVAGGQIEVTLSMESLKIVVGIPEVDADETEKPWLVEFADSSGINHTFRIATTMPDHSLGLILCLCERYKP